ncbi:MAG TPA: pitrilysin family protein [Anaeromyxobacteraceae bacterium]|nr:pitrilysin family protein [Anaeromyxobacteraceae bacterium]
MSAPIVLPPIRRERLAGGLSAVVAERQGVPLAAVRVAVRGGSSLDPSGRFGLAHLVALVARRGSRRRSGPRIDEEIESLGAEMGSGVDEDACFLGLSAPVESLARCLDVLADVAAAPAFPIREVGRMRRREVAALMHDLDEPGVVADRAMQQAAWGRHPYGHPSEGRVRHLAAARRADLVAFHRAHWRPGRATVIVVGPLPADQVLGLLRRRFARWRGPAADLPAPPPPPPMGRSVVVVDKPDLTQTHIRIVSPGFARTSPDYTAGMVASAVLGGGFASRLNEALRVNRGLTYGVRSRFEAGAAGGVFFVATHTKNESAAEAVEVALGELARFQEEGPAPEELARTQSYLRGLFPLSLETHEQLAERLTDVELYGLGDEEITRFRERVAAVTVEACRSVARRYLPGERGLLVAVGPARSLARPLERFGPVRVVPARGVI